MINALPVVTNAEKQLGASRAASLGELGSYAQIYRNDGLLNDCHGRDRLNGVVADTAFHDLTTPELQHFDSARLSGLRAKTTLVDSIWGILRTATSADL